MGSFTEKEIKEVCEKYCGNECRMLKIICDPYISKIGGIHQKDYDDFLSIANEAVYKSALSYDTESGIEFEVFLRTCIKKKFKTEVRDRNRIKRSNTRVTINEQGEKEYTFAGDVSLNAMNDMYINYLSTEGDLFAEAFKDDLENNESDRIEYFYRNIRKKSRKIAQLIVLGYSPKDIIDELNISSAEYRRAINEFRLFENVMILKGDETYWKRSKIL